jgi:CHAD domain-containing protein
LRYLAVSLKKQWRRYRKGLKRCQKQFSRKGIHEARVATRRLLSLVELLGSFIRARRVEKIRAALKRHLDAFDDLRDTQVQLQTLGKLLRAHPEAIPFQKYLRKRERRFSAKTHKAIKRVNLQQLAKLIAGCRDELKRWRKDFPPVAAKLRLWHSVEAAFVRTQRLRERINPSDPRTIHRTRIAFKRFRYMIETLAECKRLATNKLLAAMRRYQTMMGDIQDAQVLLRTFDKFLRKTSAALARFRRFREDSRRRRQALIEVYLANADQLLDFWPHTKRSHV